MFLEHELYNLHSGSNTRGMHRLKLFYLSKRLKKGLVFVAGPFATKEEAKARMCGRKKLVVLSTEVHCEIEKE